MQKFSLYVRSPESAILKTHPQSTAVLDGDLLRFDFMLDGATITEVELQVCSLPEGDVQIERATYGGLELHDLDRFGVHRDLQGCLKKTYGHMDAPGTYKFKLRFGAMVHRYITYLLAKCHG